MYHYWGNFGSAIFIIHLNEREIGVHTINLMIQTSDGSFKFHISRTPKTDVSKSTRDGINGTKRKRSGSRVHPTIGTPTSLCRHIFVDCDWYLIDQSSLHKHAACRKKNWNVVEYLDGRKNPLTRMDMFPPPYVTILLMQLLNPSLRSDWLMWWWIW